VSRSLLIVTLLVLSGCNFAQLDASRCQSYGWEPGTDGYAHCMESQAEGRAAMFQQAAAQQQETQRQNTELWQREIEQNQRNQPVNCATQYIGNQAYTHCQ
jgi:hypothetical protein